MDTLLQVNLQTFAGMTTRCKATGKSGRELTICADRAAFARLRIIAQHRDMNTNKGLSLSLGPLPLVLATREGMRVKTDKSKRKVMAALERYEEPVEVLSISAVWFYDGMAVQMKVTNIPVTVTKLADVAFNRITRHFVQEGSQTAFVVDRYLDISIKSQERTSKSDRSHNPPRLGCQWLPKVSPSKENIVLSGNIRNHG